MKNKLTKTCNEPGMFLWLELVSLLVQFYWINELFCGLIFVHKSQKTNCIIKFCQKTKLKVKRSWTKEIWSGWLWSTFWTNWNFFGTVQVATGILLLISTMIYVHCQTATHSLFLCKTCNSKCFLTLLIIFFAWCSVFSNTDTIYRTAKK